MLKSCAEISVRIQRWKRTAVELCSQIPGHSFLLKLRHGPAKRNCCKHQQKGSLTNWTSVTHFVGFGTASGDKSTRVRSRLRQRGAILPAVWEVVWCSLAFLFLPTATAAASGTSGRRARARWHHSGQQSGHSYPAFWEWGGDGEGSNFARWMLKLCCATLLQSQGLMPKLLN